MAEQNDSSLKGAHSGNELAHEKEHKKYRRYMTKKKKRKRKKDAKRSA